MGSSDAYRRPWLLGLVVFIIVLAVDIPLLAPWVSWEHDSQDSGDLVCSAHYLGIPHPTGYPTYCITAKIFQTIVPVKSLAWRTNLFSAVCAALCCAVVALAVHRLLYGNRRRDPKAYPVPMWAVPGLAALCLGFSRTFLSQSVVSEVYTLNALFVALDIALIIELFSLAKDGTDDGKIRRILIALAVIYALTLTNHLSSAFIVPLVAAAFISSRRALNPRTMGLCAAGFVAGLLPYLYLPIRSAADTPFDWGNPQTTSGFIWVVSGTQFKHLMFASFDYQVLHRLFDRFEPTLEIGPILVLCTIWASSVLFKGGTSARITLIVLLLAIFNIVPVMNYHIADTRSFLLPTFIGLAILVAIGLDDILRRLALARMKTIPAIALLMVVLLSIPWFIGNIRHADLSNEDRPREYAAAVYESLPPKAILIETYYGRAFTMWYKHYIEPGAGRKDVAIIYSEHLMFDWGIEALDRQYPWIDFPKPDDNEEKAIADLVERNASDFPTFVSREISTLKKSFALEPFGEIFLVHPLEKNMYSKHNN